MHFACDPNLGFLRGAIGEEQLRQGIWAGGARERRGGRRVSSAEGYASAGRDFQANSVGAEGDATIGAEANLPKMMFALDLDLGLRRGGIAWA